MGGSLNLVNSRIHENMARYGGAISVSGLTKIVNTIITDNYTSVSLGESWSSAAISVRGELYLFNCILANNTSADGNSGALIAKAYENHHIINNIFINNDIDCKYEGDSNNIYNNYIDSSKIIPGDLSPFAIRKDNINSSEGGLEFNNDTELKPLGNSVTIDSGFDPTDFEFEKLLNTDTDNFDQILEYLEKDKDERARIIGDTIDLGPYEFDPENPPVVEPDDPDVDDPPLTDASLSETFVLTIPNISFQAIPLNTSLVFEPDFSIPNLLLWKIVSQEESNIQLEQSIFIDENYEISFSRVYYNGNLLEFPILLVPYFNSNDPFVLYWTLGG